MSPGNAELVEIVISWAVSVPAVAAILILDDKRLSAEEIERSWPPPSRDATIFGSWLVGIPYGCAGLIAHFALTRRSIKGFLVGLGWAIAVFGVDLGAQVLAAVAVDWLGV